jgi:hypothetical protein
MPATIDLAQALAGLNRLVALNMSPWLTEVGRHEVTQIQHRIRETKGSPDNVQWSPWRPRTYLHRLAAGNIEQGLLWDTGHLLHSIRFEATPDRVEIGTDVSYAKELQEGRENMRARPFVGWGDEELGFSLGLSDLKTLEGSAIAFIEGWMK